MELSNLRYKKGSRNHKSKTYGRGAGSGSLRGFKGNKGQGQRITGAVRPGFEGGQTPIYRRTKKIGFNNYEFANNFNVITLRQIETLGNINVNASTLAKVLKDKALPIKVIASDVKLTKAYVLSVNKISAGAQRAVELVGGTVSLIK
jgi:large subunit ribosomal protein L15